MSPLSKSSVGTANANVDESKDELYPFFINEAAYYEKGFGFAVAKKCIVEF